MKTPLFVFLLIGYLFSPAFGQQVIELKNPSFEDVPRKGVIGQLISDWEDCGSYNFPGESPPDIHPLPDPGAWGVSDPAYEGMTYLGLVARASNTYESVTQQLDQPLQRDNCYEIKVYLSISEKYESPTKESLKALVNFNHPLALLIWGGNGYCSRQQLLLHTAPVSSKDWTLYTIYFSPNDNYEYITIGGFYAYGYQEPYNGHILIDALSPIVEIDCKE
ncbi:MAG: hypothetical protein M3R25_03745 [Bacteroidota bacterium]|nr:hypothetical protein [Bacteroidota bacterium]